jgi:predicted RNA-binding protein with PIN domain
LRYYIDGYNLIFAQGDSSGGLQAAREQLINQLRPLADKPHWKLIVVFDAHAEPEEAMRHHIDALEVVYTGLGETADHYILNEIETAAKPKQIVVVTGDLQLAKRAEQRDAQTLDPATFWQRGNKRSRRTEEAKPADSSSQERQRWFKIFRKRLEKEDEQ